MEKGRLDPNSPYDLLFLGSKTNILAFDVEMNVEKFDHELGDGLNCLRFGKVQGVEEPVIIGGGNCSIVGLDIEAEEKFWTVTGDNVASLAMVDWDEDGEEELVVGSDDFAIRVFKGEELIFDVNE